MKFIKNIQYVLTILLIFFYAPVYGGDVQRLTVSAVGDIMCHDSQLAAALNRKTKQYDFKPMFHSIMPLLQQADLNIGNLETTLPGKEYKGYPQFGSPDSLAQAIKDAGFHILTTANNHSMDRGTAGLQRTLDILDKNKILYTGTYRSPAERMQRPFLTIEKNGIQLVLLNYTYGTNGIAVPRDVVVNLMQEELIRDDIAQARATNPDFTIVSYHFGNEYERLPSEEQKKFVNLAFAEGADVVIGSHPHVVQPYEIKRITDRYGVERDRLVMYSLGNFISGQTKPYTMGGLLLYFTLEKDKTGHRIKDVRHQQVFTVRPPGSFSLQPMPQLFDTALFKKLPAAKQTEIKDYYQDVEKHLLPSVRMAATFRSSAPATE